MNIKSMNMEKITFYKNKINLNEIVSNPDFIKSEEPLYIVDLGDIVNKYFVWKQAMPRVQPFYAVKCNDHPVILKLLNDLGTGFDCASKGEISRVMDLNVNPNRIIFANPTKPVAHLLHAKQFGVYTMTFDGEFELHKIKKYFPDASLVLRIRCEAEKAQCPLGDKFGCDPLFDAPKLLKVAKDLDLNVIGISFHVGSGCQDFPVYERAIEHSKNLFEIGENLGFKMNVLDIGGGFPGERNSKIFEVGAIVSRALDKYFPGEDVNLIAEPGRFFVASSHTLICKVHSKRDVIRNNKLENVMYFINDGVYGSFNCILYDHQAATPQYFPTIDDHKKEENLKTYKSSIWGPTCDGLDKICDDVYLPEIELGGILIFENMGAYTVPIASAFNGFPLPKLNFYMNIKYKLKNIKENLNIYKNCENNEHQIVSKDNVTESCNFGSDNNLKLIRNIKYQNAELYNTDYVDDINIIHGDITGKLENLHKENKFPIHKLNEYFGNDEGFHFPTINGF